MTEAARASPRAGQDRVDRRLRRDPDPQPVQHGVDAPTRFIDGDDGTAAHGRTQRVVGRLRLARRAMDRLHQPAARDRQAEAVAQQRRDLAGGEAEPLVEEHGDGHRLRPQLCRRRAQRIGGLQGMPALHAAPALRALANVDVKATHAGPLHGELFLVLGRDADPPDGPLTVRARRRQRRGVRLVDVRRPTATGGPAIGRTRFAARTVWMRASGATRERGRLAVDGAARGLEVVFQFLVLAPQALALRFRPTQVVPQPLDFASLLVDDLLRVGRCRRLVVLRHTAVMPNLRSEYKWKMAVSHH